MVDININILQLPIEEAKLELAKLEDCGYLHVILVYPVLQNGEYDFPEMINKFNQLKAEAKNINLMLGNLIHYHSSMIHRLQEKQILTLNNSPYILLELPSDEKPKLLKAAIEFLKDYKIIIVQPHKWKYYNYKELVELREMGVKFLICYSDTESHKVRKLLKKQMIDFMVAGLSKDMEISKKADKLIDQEYSQRLVSGSFQEIIQKY